MVQIFLILFFPFLFLACGESTGKSSSTIPTPTTQNAQLTNANKLQNKPSIPMLVVLLSYDNIQVRSSEESWSERIFGLKEGSLNHYFDEVSGGRFVFESVTESYGVCDNGVIAVKLDKPHPNVSVDLSTFDSLVHSDLKSALESADRFIDFSLYDSDASGAITPDELLITFIVAGYEDSYEGRHVNYGMWAHQYCVAKHYTPLLDGVLLMGCAEDGNYAVFGERHDVNRRLTHDATIGIIAHELGHSAFGLPDLYNTHSSQGGIGYFGLMGGGLWAQKSLAEPAGATPVHLCAWSKQYVGWMEPEIKKGSTTLTHSASRDFDVIKIPINAKEYYLLENRHNAGYDRGLFSLEGTFVGGVAIWHVDENHLDESDILANSVNADPRNMGVKLMEAQELGIMSGGGGGAQALFYAPHAKSFDTKVRDISAPSELITLIVE